MKKRTFNGERWAKHYGETHFRVDSGVQAIFYLPTNAPEREVRLLEVNSEIPELSTELEPLNFGVGRGTESDHSLVVLDVTPNQWKKLEKKQIGLPSNWTLEGKVEIARPERRR